MKTIFINESSMSNVLSKRLLPQFLFKMIKNHTTSLGDNEAFPTSDDYPFDYTLLKSRYNEVCDEIESMGVPSLDEDSLVSELSSLVKNCKELEKPVRDSLEKICENALNKLFAIPEESINFKFKLVDKVKFKGAIRMRPESSESVQYTFKDIADIDLSNKAVKKRRFIDALIQGASYTYSRIEGLYLDEIDKINPELPRMYRKIRAINDYLLFTKKEEMSDDKPMQGSYVETHLGIDNSKAIISVQGIIFPLLLQEAIRGMFELFSSHGLPQDRKKAEYIVKKADFVLAEPWDLRLGVGLWNKIFGGVEDTNMIPYMFTAFIKLPTDEFNLSAKEILSSTEKGKAIVDELIKNAEYDNGYQQFTNRINARNVDKSLIQDSYFTGAETNGYEIDTEDGDGDVIEEDGEPNNYFELLASATVDNIDFVEGEENEYGEEVFLTIDGVEIPKEIVNLTFRPIYKRFPTGKMQMLQIDIILDEQARGHGLGTKIYAKAVYEFGAICSRFSTRHNDDGIRGIFSKLNGFGDIYAFEDAYQNADGETISDYYAILKSQLPNYVSESKQTSKGLITESFSKTKNTIIRRTVDILRQGLPWASSVDAQKYEKEIANDFFHGRRGSNEKFRPLEQVIAKILVDELGYPNNPLNKKQIYKLKEIFDYIYLEAKNGMTPDIHYGFNNKTNKFECDNFETIIAKYDEKARAYREQAKSKALDGSGNGYEIIEVKTFEEAQTYTPYLTKRVPLCFTTGRGMWDSFTDGGSNTAYVCLKDGWQRWRQGDEKETDQNFPYDDYGLSVIWVFVDEEGNLTNCCIRWNHHGEERMKEFQYGGTDADHALSAPAIEEIIDRPFDATFIPQSVNEFNEAVQNVLTRLANGERDVNNLFHVVESLNGYLCAVKIKNKYNFYDSRTNEITNPDFWFDDYNEIKKEGFDVVAIVTVSRKRGMSEISNLINNDGKLVFPENLWFDSFSILANKYFKILIGGKYNIFDKHYNQIFSEWALGIHRTGNHYVVVFDNGKSYAAIDGNFENLYSLEDIVNEHLHYGDDLDHPNYTSDFFKLLGGRVDENGIVSVCEFFNVVKDGHLLSPVFFDSIGKNHNEDFYRCIITDGYCDRFNMLREDGTFLFKDGIEQWPSKVNLSMNGNYFECAFPFGGHEKRFNFIDFSGNPLFKNEMSKWPDEIYQVRYGSEAYSYWPREGSKGGCYYRIRKGTKYNLLSDTLELVWKEPTEKWFDYIASYFDFEYVKVTIGNLDNYISADGRLVDNCPVEEWPRRIDIGSISPTEKYFSIYKNRGYNIILPDGSKLFDDYDVCYDISNLDSSTLILCKTENGPFNIYNIEERRFVSEQWFDRYEEEENLEYVHLYIGDTEFVYDIKSKELINVAQKRNERLTALNPDEDKDIDVFIPGKLYRVTERDYRTSGKLCNLIVNNGGHYEYLFDKWYPGIGKPLGNIVVIRKDSKNFYKDIYNLATNSVILKDILVDDVDREANLILFWNKDETCQNAITPEGELLFEHWPRTIAFCGENYLRVSVNRDVENIFDLRTRKFISNENYPKIDFVSGTTDIFVARIEDNESHFLYNIIGENGDPLFKDWYMVIVPVNQEIALVGQVVGKQGIFNYGNMRTGELVSDTPLDFSRGSISLISKNGKYNYISSKGELANELLLGDNWADKATAPDGRGFVKVTYGNNTYLYQAVDGKLNQVDLEGETTIPFDFTEYNSNKINLIDHTLFYTLVGYREGQSEHTTTYTQKVVVTTTDGRKAEKMYTQRGDEPCKWTMYEAYETVCKQLGIKPASME